MGDSEYCNADSDIDADCVPGSSEPSDSELSEIYEQAVSENPTCTSYQQTVTENPTCTFYQLTVTENPTCSFYQQTVTENHTCSSYQQTVDETPSHKQTHVSPETHNQKTSITVNEYF